MTRYSLPLSPLFSPTFRVEEPAPHLIRLSVCPSVCLFALFVWFSSKIPRGHRRWNVSVRTMLKALRPPPSRPRRIPPLKHWTFFGGHPTKLEQYRED